MKIGLDLIPILGKEAGFSRYAKQLVGNLPKYRPNNDYVIFKNSNATLKEIPDSNNIEKVSVWAPPKIHFLWDQVYLSILSRFEDLDILHSPVSAPLYHPPSSTDYIVTVHDIAYEIFPETVTKFGYYYWSFFMRHGLNKADKIIAISESTKNDIIDHYNISPSKISVVYNAVPEEFYYNSSSVASSSSLDQLGVHNRYFLFVGTIEPRKNITSLIRAFNRVNKKYDNEFQLVIVGKKGWNFAEVFDLVEQLNIQNDVKFTGFVSDDELSMLYSKAEAFLFPALYEGFGYPVLEAMSYELPVLASNSSALTEVVGNAGVLVDPRSVDEITEGINRLIKNKGLAKRLKKKGIQRLEKFSLDKMINQTISCYEDLKGSVK